MLHVPTHPNQLWVRWSPSQFTMAKGGGFSLQTPLHSTALSSCNISTHKAEIELSSSHPVSLGRKDTPIHGVRCQQAGREMPAHSGPPGFAHSKVKGYGISGTTALFPAPLVTLTLPTRVLAGAQLQTLGALSELAER